MVFINIIIAQEVQSVSVGFCLRTTKQYTTAIVGDSRAIGYGWWMLSRCDGWCRCDAGQAHWCGVLVFFHLSFFGRFFWRENEGGWSSSTPLYGFRQCNSQQNRRNTQVGAVFANQKTRHIRHIRHQNRTDGKTPPCSRICVWPYIRPMRDFRHPPSRGGKTAPYWIWRRTTPPKCVNKINSVRPHNDFKYLKMWNLLIF